jgi:hypothetical protein
LHLTRAPEVSPRFLLVIPAKAGIQSGYVVRSTHYFLLGVAHIVFALDAGFRRNDEQKDVGIPQS